MNKIENKLIMDWTFAKIESWAVKIAKKNNNKNERKHVSQQSTRKQKGVSCIWPSERKKTSYYRFDRTLYTSFMADCFVSCKTFFLKKLQQDFDQQFVEWYEPLPPLPPPFPMTKTCILVDHKRTTIYLSKNDRDNYSIMPHENLRWRNSHYLYQII